MSPNNFNHLLFSRERRPRGGGGGGEGVVPVDRVLESGRQGEEVLLRQVGHLVVVLQVPVHLSKA
jgi:hypothetical protein